MNLNVHYHLDDEDDPRIDCEIQGPSSVRYPVLYIGDLSIFPTLDQLEMIAGVIGQYLHVHRPAPTAKASEPDRRELIQRRMPSRERIQQVIDKSRPLAMACPECGEAMEFAPGYESSCGSVLDQRVCTKCGHVEPIPVAEKVPAEAATASEDDGLMSVGEQARWAASMARSKARRDEIYRHADERRDAQRAAKEGERAMGLAVDVNCPDCGSVNVKADVWEHGKPISGECPKCGERLYFDSPSKPRASAKVAGPALDIDETMYDMASSFEIDRPRCPDSDYGCSEEQLEAVAQRQTPEVP